MFRASFDRLDNQMPKRSRLSMPNHESNAPSELRQLEPDYEFLRGLGTRGALSTYLARHRATGRLVAVELVRPRSDDERDELARILREAAPLVGLDHPNLVRLDAVIPINGGAAA